MLYSLRISLTTGGQTNMANLNSHVYMTYVESVRFIFDTAAIIRPRHLLGLWQLHCSHYCFPYQCTFEFTPSHTLDSSAYFTYVCMYNVLSFFARKAHSRVCTGMHMVASLIHMCILCTYVCMYLSVPVFMYLVFKFFVSPLYLLSLLISLCALPEDRCSFYIILLWQQLLRTN